MNHRLLDKQLAIQKELDKPAKSDNVQMGGDHYVTLAVQPWHAMHSWMTREQFTGYLIGSVISYLARFNAKDVSHKGGLQDIKKASHTLIKLIETLEDDAS